MQADVNKVIHIGYPKAGSSFLQNNIFPFLKNYEVVNYTKGKHFCHYVLHSGMFFNVGKAIGLLPPTSGNAILSNELLVGNPISGIGVNDEKTPHKLKASGFNKVVISLRRNHEKWTQSLYNEFIKLGGKLTWKDFLSNPSRHDKEYTWYHPAMLDFSDDYVRHYQEVFGKENVLVIYIEDMKNNTGPFIQSILDFFQSKDEITVQPPSNESMPAWIQHCVRFFNNFSSSRMAPSSTFRWFTTARVIRFFQFFVNKSITKYK